MATTYFIRTQALHRFDALVSELGANAVDLLSDHGLTIAALSSQEQTIDISVLVNLLNHSAELLNCPDLGLRLGAKQDFTMLGPLGLLLQNCRTPREALRATRGFMAFHNQTEYWHYQEYPGQVVIQRIENFTAISDSRQYKELAISAFYHLTRRLLGEQFKLVRIDFSHAPLAAPQAYRQRFNTDVTFNAEQDRIVVDKTFLDVPITGSQEDIKTNVAEYLQGLKQRYEWDVVQQVSTLIQLRLSAQEASIESIADLLNTHKRTLQRQLKQQGVVFRSLLNDIRLQTAKWYLTSSQMEITLLSDLLGYTDVSNFSRAFKAATGASPAHWRMRKLTPSNPKQHLV